MFHLPLREIEDRFTKSELVIVAWRSQEIFGKMNSRQKKHGQTPPTLPEVSSAPEENYKPRDPALAGIPDSLINEEGEFDLRLATGPQAWHYMMKQGIRIPMIQS